MGLGNRLKSKGGRAPHPHTPAASPLPGGRDDSATSGHVTKVGRMPSFKRKGSHEDLLANKRWVWPTSGGIAFSLANGDELHVLQPVSGNMLYLFCMAVLACIVHRIKR